MGNTYPIAVMSFNRPDYLRAVLHSLREQTVPISPSEVFLFQDGYRSKRGKDLTNPLLIEECVAVFKNIFPTSNVFVSEDNLGVALNFARAEEIFFAVRQNEAAFFFEDDLIITPHYLTALYALTELALAERRIAYVAAYGDHRAPLAQQRLTPRKLIPMNHKWGFALTRRQWLAQREIVEPYLEIIRRTDYRSRDHVAIREYFKQLGYGSHGTSQDGMKDVASCVLGTTKIMTFACFGKYIGEVGLHSTRQSYQREGFEKIKLYPQEISLFDFPSEEQLDRWIAALRDFGRNALGQASETAIAASPKISGDGAPEEPFLRALYRVLLMREPDPDGLAVHLRSVRAGKNFDDVMRSFLRSSEFRSKYPRFTHLYVSPAVDANPVTKAQRQKAIMTRETQIQALRAAQTSGIIKLVIGAGGTGFPGWVSTDANFLDLLKPETWEAWLAEASVEAILAEHVWEHLDAHQALVAAQTCYRFLAPGKRIRIAVPDALMPDPEYRELCRIGNRDGHKSFFDYRTLTEILQKANLTVEILEYWDENGIFHRKEWSSLDGYVCRSLKFDSRNSGENIAYTSLIIDAFKPSK